jgi:exodeoxyribonuclease VII large subunit
VPERHDTAVPASPVAARLPWSVGALLLATSDLLAARFGAVAVRGELSSFTRAASGHCYFSLKDAGGAPALLRCAMFRRAAALLDFPPADGQQVELRGRLGVYDARGELQLVVESMQRVGAGTLYEEFLRLKARLEAQGLFEAARKRPLPRFPAAIGVVTSLGAAALQDVLTALRRRAPHVRVVVYPAPVQGAEAPAALAAAIALAGQRAEVDLLLLVRGGGSLEDLWAFNDERVVRAVAASVLPLVCGVGHETDLTLADLAAELRAPTPTAAAELAAPARDEALVQLRTGQLALQRAAARWLQARAQRLDLLALRLDQPARAVARQHDRLQALGQRLRSALQQRLMREAGQPAQRAESLSRALVTQLQQQRWRQAALQQRLQALDPARVLQRGYAWVEDEAGQPITGVRGLRTGQTVRAVWGDGRAEAELKQVEALPPAT